MYRAGIPVHRRRSAQEPFHITIGVVSPHYPLAQVLPELAQRINFTLAPAVVDRFVLLTPPRVFFAASE